MATEESSSNATGATDASADHQGDHQGNDNPAYEHLRALLSLENPACQICAEDVHELNGGCISTAADAAAAAAAVNTADDCASQQQEKVRLVPMPHCKCRTTLASVHVRPSDLPLPPTDNVDNNDAPSFLQQLLNSQPCLSSSTTPHHKLKRLAFTARKPPTATFAHLATCTACLPRWAASANDVQRYTYNDDPGGNEMCFTNDVRCAQCQRLFAKRTVDRLLTQSGEGGGAKGGEGGRSREDDEWTRSVECTAQVVAWADRVKAWARGELANDNNTASRGDAEQQQQLTAEQSHLRSVLLSIVGNNTAPSLGEDGVHRQELQHGEMKRELMQRDPKFAQEVEDGEFVRKLAEEEEREAEEERRRRQEADERMARELADAEREGGNGSAAANTATNTAAAASMSASTASVPAVLASHQKRVRRQREEEEKKSEELARRMQQEWEEEERRERERREKRDAKLARKLYNADRREKTGLKRKGSPTPLFGEPVRKSPFDSNNRTAGASKQSKDDVVDITDSPTKAAGGDTSDDEYVRLSPLASKKSKVEKPSEEKAPSAKEKDKIHPQDLSCRNDHDDKDGNTNEEEVDNNKYEQPQLLTQAASPFPTPRAVDTSARKRPPPTTTPSSNRKPPPMQANSTPRHRSGSKQGADFSADRKKEENWDEGNDSDLQFLIDMGFDWKEAKSCYLDADKDVEKAAAMLSSAMEERERAKKRG